LGKGIDQSMHNSEPTMAGIVFEMNNGGEMTSAKPMIRFKDPKHFVVEYVLPDYPQEIGKLIAKDGKMVMLRDNKFGDPKLPSNPKKFGKAEIATWTEEFPIRMFDGFWGGTGNWEQLMTALSDPKNGFDTKFEEQVANVEVNQGK